MVIVGSKGLEEVDLIIPQSTTRDFDVVHMDDASHEVIDHSGSTARMAFQSKDKKTTWILDSCCSCTAEKIRVVIPASMTGQMPVGKMNWDMIVTTDLGEVIRMCYGSVNIVDTYAHDEEA